MTPTLAIEALMLHPRYAELAAKLRALAPVDLIDQADTATDRAGTLMAAGAAILGADGVHPANPAAIPGWLRLGVLDTLTTWATGNGRTCAHNPTPDRPQPVLAAAWKPGLVTCLPCVRLFTLPRGSNLERVCDACGHQCTELDGGDGIYPAMVQLGPLVYQYGVCARCVPGEPL
ncbi:hypothetical protein CSH63_29320 [Micromonospora tulbaghiae]|uniref:Uncharacterized protein n=1 Tax=Micromonospora tulbaghiae TaxID=479978 RepID=A0A386WSR4_9ACTN|nr:hypothetical protein [Micromonospora tulbaghiae]AYF31475.1 hypothetical protein CSH63_29320 [Micromonospora tulbaghiae]